MKKNIDKLSVLILCLSFVVTDLFSQPVVVLPGNNSTSGNGRAPQGSRRFINTKYIILASELTTSGFSGAVTSVGWRWNVPMPPAAAVPVAQNMATTGALKVFLKDTSAAAVALTGTFIDTSGAGYTKVIQGTIDIPAGIDEFIIDVPVGGPGTAAFTPTPGNAVIVMFVYSTTTATLATPLASPTVLCTNSPAGNTLLGYLSNTVGGTTGTTSVFRPETRFGKAPTIPITLADFKAAYNSTTKNTLIQWSTSNEFNTRIFNIERSIDDGRNFESIGSVSAAGTSNSTLQYQFNDVNPVQGTNFYRLKTIDLDDRFQYSNIVSVRIKETNIYSVFPNPAKSFALINTTKINPAPVTVELINSEGKIIKAQNMNIIPGQLSKFDFININPGIYFIKIYSDKDDASIQKLVIQ